MGVWDESHLANGIKVDTANVPSRKEISSLEPKELYLFLEGLEKFKAVPFTESLSYFQIAGIHGLPFRTEWPRGDKEQEELFNNDVGYCTHSSIIFLTWHRPYLALFESQLRKHAIDIADGIDDPEYSEADKKEYMEIAQNLRLPYWDWTLWGEKGIYPAVALDEREPKGPRSKNSAKGKQRSKNPLFSYIFPDKDTLRKTYPKLNVNALTLGRKDTGRNMPSEEEQKKFYGYGNANNLAERVFYILTSYKQWDTMSNNSWFQNNPKNPDKTPVENIGNWGSLEDIHNSIHDYTGGHMGDTATAAFDPIFWLHHANIDRLMAIWQAVNRDETHPKFWVQQRLSRSVSVTSPGRGKNYENEDTALYPFRDTMSTWYSSKKTRKTDSFGYTYDEIKDVTYPFNDKAKNTLLQKLSIKNKSLADMIKDSKKEDKNAGAHLVVSAKMHEELAKVPDAKFTEAIEIVSDLPSQQILLDESNEENKPVLRGLAPDNKYKEWLVNIKGRKHALEGRYRVHVFLNNVDIEEQNVALWPLSPHYVGVFVPFGQPRITGCEKCLHDQENDLYVTGQIPLTIALVERYLARLVESLEPDHVVPYLQQNLHWRVTLNNEIVDRSRLSDTLLVAVTSNEVTLPENEGGLPIYADEVRVHPAITTKANSNEGRGNDTGYTGPAITV